MDKTKDYVHNGAAYVNVDGVKYYVSPYNVKDIRVHAPQQCFMVNRSDNFETVGYVACFWYLYKVATADMASIRSVVTKIVKVGHTKSQTPAFIFNRKGELQMLLADKHMLSRMRGSTYYGWTFKSFNDDVIEYTASYRGSICCMEWNKQLHTLTGYTYDENGEKVKQNELGDEWDTDGPFKWQEVFV